MLSREGCAFRSRFLVCCALIASFGAAAQTQDSADKKAPATWKRVVRLDLARHVQALGDRMQKSGKERTTLTGVLALAEQKPVSVTLMRELPWNVRVSQLGKANLLFDSAGGYKGGATLDKNEEDLLETLAYDWPDQFFVNHGDGSGLRLVVQRAQVRESGRATGVLYDVYDTLDKIQVSKTPRYRSARYCLNSNTGLVERVHYQNASGPVEVRFSEWLLTDGQRIPGRVERLENGKTTLTLTFTAATFTQAMNDGAFSRQGD